MNILIILWLYYLKKYYICVCACTCRGVETTFKVGRGTARKELAMHTSATSKMTCVVQTQLIVAL